MSNSTLTELASNKIKFTKRHFYGQYISNLLYIYLVVSELKCVDVQTDLSIKRSFQSLKGHCYGLFPHLGSPIAKRIYSELEQDKVNPHLNRTTRQEACSLIHVL
jgi:hypothetical protein